VYGKCLTCLVWKYKCLNMCCWTSVTSSSVVHSILVQLSTVLLLVHVMEVCIHSIQVTACTQPFGSYSEEAEEAAQVDCHSLYIGLKFFVTLRCYQHYTGIDEYYIPIVHSHVFRTSKQSFLLFGSPTYRV
jgi:hypothetical protein